MSNLPPHATKATQSRQDQHRVPRVLVAQDLTPDRDAATNLFTSSGATYKCDIDFEVIEVLQDLKLRYNVQGDASCVLLPSEYHFETVEVITHKGADGCSQEWTSDALYWLNSGFRTDKEQANYNRVRRLEKYGDLQVNSQLTAATDYEQQLDLNHLWPVVAKIYGRAWDSQIQLRLKPRSNIVEIEADGTAGSGTTITNGTITVQTVYDQVGDRGHEYFMAKNEEPQSVKMLVPRSDSFTVPIATMTASTVITSGETANGYELSNINGEVEFLLVAIRSDRTTAPLNVNQNLLGPFQDLGPDGIIELKNSRGVDLLNNGTDNTVRHIEEMMDAMLPNDFLRKNHIYMIPFTHDPVGAVKKGKSGHGLNFSGNRSPFLYIKTGSAGTDSKLEFKSGTLPAAGSFTIHYGDSHTAPIAFDATNAEINRHLRELGQPYGVCPYTNEELDTDTTVNILFTGEVDHQGRSMSISTDFGGTYVAVSQTWTPGTRGFQIDPGCGTEFTVQVIGFVWEQVDYFNNKAQAYQIYNN